ncbi:GNAT family N-acetyltransferase [Citricoccus sp. NR2]|uniref:GNAT family N-acetyltransferase n=1 Tax=Citricoccus sp. NR2 TaxID=3004095 RepID=UPI0022DD134B|nr:N-acetyltransferase [Citricoccus sp. NR2]WBL20054.1 N-acetyltransferase [Citricoccus sp. NR2]
MDSQPSRHSTQWSTRAERPGEVQDHDAVRAINIAAFPTPDEANLVDALRADPDAWIEGLSMLSLADDGTPVGHALLTRCTVGGQPALALAPCAVDPAHQRRGAGAAAIRAVLDAARDRGENLVVVLGHADYYPRFGFAPGVWPRGNRPLRGARRGVHGAGVAPIAAHAARRDSVPGGLRRLSPGTAQRQVHQ